MRLYHSLRPHPVVGAGREVRIVLYEKGLDVAKVDLDLLKGENRRPEYLRMNPAGQMPFLELDDGTVIAETTAIAEYFEELHPAQPVVGTTPEERAQARMWQRRIELGVVENITHGFHFGEGAEFWKSRGRVVPEAAAGLKAIARDKLEWLNGLMDGQAFIAGERFTLADILLVCALDFAAVVGQGLDPGLTHLVAWKRRMDYRPSVRASLTS